jgi:hypothetical protein
MSFLLAPRKIKVSLAGGSQGVPKEAKATLMPNFFEVGPMAKKTYFLELLLDLNQLLEVQILKFNLLLCHCRCVCVCVCLCVCLCLSVGRDDDGDRFERSVSPNEKNCRRHFFFFGFWGFNFRQSLLHSVELNHFFQLFFHLPQQPFLMPPKRASRAKASSGSKDTDSQDVVMEGHTPAVAVESAAEEPNQTSADGNITAIIKRSVKRTRELFAEDQDNIYSTPTEDQLRCVSS